MAVRGWMFALVANATAHFSYSGDIETRGKNVKHACVGIDADWRDATNSNDIDTVIQAVRQPVN